MKYLAAAILLLLTGCHTGTHTASGVEVCDYQAEFVNRLTGERMWITVDPPSEFHDGWDIVQSLVWCDDQILCPEEIAPSPYAGDYSLPDLPPPSLPPGERRIIVDPKTRLVEGFIYFARYRPGGPGWDLLSSIIIEVDWGDGSVDLTFPEAVMVHEDDGSFLDLLSYADADGCRLRVPDGIRLGGQD